MRILFVADGRSAIALNWIGGIIARGHEVHLLSTFPCETQIGLASLEFVPVAFSKLKSEKAGASSAASSRRLGGAALVRVRTGLRQWLGPLTFASATRQLRAAIERVQPDLVHVMRIPYEGMVAALAMETTNLPLLVSVWGNDFTLHAPSTPWMSAYTRRALRRADALHADCRRDVRHAVHWGFDHLRPSLVLPGAGGIQLDLFHPAAHPDLQVMERTPVLINPRGVRAYVRNDTFFKALPLVVQRFPNCRILCTGMMGDGKIERWVEELGLRAHVDLLPVQTRVQMAALFRGAQLAVSPTTHDGTPNTLLEAMASGCLPVAGDLELIREWITPGVNGLLVDAGDPGAIAEAIMVGFENPDLCRRAEAINRRLIAERAEFNHCMLEAENFYQRL